MMKSNLSFIPSSAIIAVVFLSAFSSSVNHSPTISKEDLLTFDYIEFDGGTQLINDKNTAFFPFINNSERIITIDSITSTNSFSNSPYTLLNPTLPAIIKPGQHDTIFFQRSTHSLLNTGSHNHIWYIHYKETAVRHKLNILCQLAPAPENLIISPVVLETVHRGFKITFQTTIHNSRNYPVEITPMSNWNSPGLILTDTYPITISSGESKTLNFQLDTKNLYTTPYQGSAYFNTNSDDLEWIVFNYSGHLIIGNE